MSTDMKPSEIYTRAGDLIDRQGWARGWYWDDAADKAPKECPLDAVGALNVACGHEPDHDVPGDPGREVIEAFARRVAPGAAGEDPHAVIGEWNDAAGRTREQVVAEFRAAALVEQEAGR